MAETKKYLDLVGLSHYDEKIKGVVDAKDASTLQSAKDYTDNKIGTLGEGITTVAAAIVGEKNRAEGAEGALSGRLDTIEADYLTSADAYDDSALAGRVEALEGKHAEGKTVAEEAAAEVAKVVANAPEAFDTLKEIADWIGTGDVASTTAASMLTDINTLKGAVGAAKDGETAGTGLTGRVGAIEAELAGADTFAAITENEIDALFAAE